MKKQIVSISMLVTTFAFLFIACEQEPLTENNSILPESFSVDIPEAISNDGQSASLKSATADTSDEFNGGHVYKPLVMYIKVGESAAEIVDEIIRAIRLYDLDQAGLSFDYEGDDGRIKKCEVEGNVTYNNLNWEYGLTISDAASLSDSTNGKAMQVFWNNSPVYGVAIIQPAMVNFNDRAAGKAMYRVTYSEAGNLGYEQHMEVEIAGIPEDVTDHFWMNNMKMFVGKKNGIVEVYGNSNHPNATLFSEDEPGLNWAFTAAGADNDEHGVAEIALPPSNLDTANREQILAQYAIRETFLKQILKENEAEFNKYNVYTTSDLDEFIYSELFDGVRLFERVRRMLENTEAPGFFANKGFVGAGKKYAGEHSEYDPLLNAIEGLSPYNPKTIAELSIQFK